MKCTMKLLDILKEMLLRRRKRDRIKCVARPALERNVLTSARNNPEFCAEASVMGV